MLRRRLNRKAAAMVFVLMITALMAVLMGAFVTINQAQIRLTGNTAEREAAYQACLSGLAYAQSQLEANQNWARAPFATGETTLRYPLSAPIMNVTVFGADATTADGRPDTTVNYLTATYRTAGGAESEFTVRVINNLTERDALMDAALGAVPGRAARLWVEGRSGKTVRRIDVVLRKKPFVDSGIAAGDDLKVEFDPTGTTGWAISSRDPLANQVRVNGNVTAPDPGMGLLKFRGGSGKLRASEDIRLSTGPSDPGRSVRAMSANERLAAETAAEGKIKTDSNEIEIPDLDKNQLRLPTNTLTLAAGDYTFGTTNQTTWTPQTQMQDTDGDPSTPPVPVVVAWEKKVDTFATLETPTNYYGTQQPIRSDTEIVAPADKNGNDGWDNNRTPIQQDVVELAQGNFQQINPGGGSSTVTRRVTATLANGTLNVDPSVTAEVSGDFRIKNESGLTPKVLLGYDQALEQFPADQVGTSDMLDNYEQLSAALVSTGSIDLGGEVRGLGSISAERDLTVSAQSGLAAIPSVAVAVRAGGDLTLTPPPPTRNAGNGLKVDAQVFRSATDAQGYVNLNRWETLPYQDRLDEIGTGGSGLRYQPVKDKDGNQMTASRAWDLIKPELGLDDPPNFSSSPFGPAWSGQLTLDKYVRLREFARSGMPSWVNGEDSKVRNLIYGQISAYSSFAKSQRQTLQAFMASGADVPDIFFIGLVYAAGRVTVTGADNSFYCEGAMVSKGKMELLDTSSVSTVYNRLFLDDIVRPFSGVGTKLDLMYLNLY